VIWNRTHPRIEARETLELVALFETLERWRRIAALQADRDNFRRAARRVAELRTGESVPEDEPLRQSRPINHDVSACVVERTTLRRSDRQLCEWSGQPSSQPSVDMVNLGQQRLTDQPEPASEFGDLQRADQCLGQRGCGFGR
jgi:Family of unknown function (DUF6247)